MRAVVRFSYSNTEAAAVLDPPKAQILAHITSLQARPRASQRSFDAWVAAMHLSMSGNNFAY